MAEEETEMVQLEKQGSVTSQQNGEKEKKGEEKTAKKNRKCQDQYVSRQVTLIDRQITQTYDNAIWIEEHKIFEMLERKTSHADPELSCIFTYWKKRFRRYRARLCDKRKGTKYIDITCVKDWAEQLEGREDIKNNEKKEIEILLKFLNSFDKNDLLIWEEKQLVIPSDGSMEDKEKHKLVDKKHFCKTFQQFVEQNCKISEMTNNVKQNPALCYRKVQNTSLPYVAAENGEPAVINENGEHGVSITETVNFLPQEEQITKDGNVLPPESNQVSHNQNLKDLKQVLLMFAYAEEFRWWPPKPFSIVMFLVHLSIFLYMSYSTPSSSNGDSVPECSTLILNQYKPYEAWRYFSYSFVHFDYIHLTTNLIGIFIAGMFLEYTNKWWRIAPIFYAGVVFTGIILTSISPQPLIGMSAGVYALMAGSIPDILLNWKDIKLLLRQRFVLPPRTTKAVPTRSIPRMMPKYFKCRQIRLAIPILWIFVDGGYSIYALLGKCQKEFCGTSYEAHIIGAMTGMFVGFLWLKNRRFKTWVIVLKRVLRYILFAVIIAFLVALIAKISSESRELAVSQGRGSHCRPWEGGRCCKHRLNTGIGPCCLYYLHNTTTNN